MTSLPTSPPKFNPTRSASRRRQVLFAVLAGALMLSYYVVGLLPWMDQTFFPYYLKATAESAAYFLRVLGIEATADGSTVRGLQFSVNIKRGCDGIEPAWLLASGVIAYPHPWRRKWKALLAGIALMQVLNLLRVASLFAIGQSHPRLFSTAHLELWPAVFVGVAVSFWWLWVRANRDTPPPRCSEH